MDHHPVVLLPVANTDGHPTMVVTVVVHPIPIPVVVVRLHPTVVVVVVFPWTAMDLHQTRLMVVVVVVVDMETEDHRHPCGVVVVVDTIVGTKTVEDPTQTMPEVLVVVEAVVTIGVRDIDPEVVAEVHQAVEEDTVVSLLNGKRIGRRIMFVTFLSYDRWSTIRKG